MKLYYSPGACSLASHIALIEAGVTAEYEKVDIRKRKTASGADFSTINRKGYVPVLVLDGGDVLTENVAILDWIATQHPALGLDGPLGRTRLIEVLAFLATEVHKPFRPFFVGGTEEEKASARNIVAGRLSLIAGRVKGEFLFGPRPSVVDFYLLVMLLWSERFGIAVPAPLVTLRDRLLSRPTTQLAMKSEAWAVPAQTAEPSSARIAGT